MKGIKKLGLALCLTAVIASAGPPLRASEYHVDPESVPVVFSGTALLGYYSEALDYVIQIEPETARDYLDALPLAEIPVDVRAVTGEFSQATVNVAFSIEEAYTLWDMRSGLIARALLDDGLALDPHIAAVIGLAQSEVAILEQSLAEHGALLGIVVSASGSGLRMAYEEVEQQIQRLRGMLELLGAALAQSHSMDEGIQGRLIPPVLGLIVTPEAVFVGDSIRFEATLSAAGDGLAGREINILLNGIIWAQALTDAAGQCSSEFTVPYWYTPEIEIRAYYQPRGADSDVYMAALSPAFLLDILFYPVAVRIELVSPALPGKESTGNLHLDYGDNPSKIRAISLYLDNQPAGQFTMGTDGPFSFALDGGLRPGSHSVSLTIPADGRYAPGSGSAVLEIIREIPSLQLDPPGTVWIPGSIEISGSIASEIGPLSGALVTLRGGSDRFETVTDSQGRFTVLVNFGLDLTFLGDRTFTLSVSPTEPWHSVLLTRTDVFTINYVNCAGAVVLLGFLGIYMPRRQGRKFRLSPGITSPAAVGLPVIPALNISKAGPAELGFQVEAGTPRWVVYNLYRQALRLMVRLGVKLPGSQQTMREYAREASPLPAGLRGYLVDFTYLAEKYFYGPRPPVLKDAESSRAFYEKIKREVGS